MDAILVKKDGVVSMNKSFDYLCSTLKNGVYTLSIKRKVEPRTLSQNALMWLWFTCMEEHTGTPKDDFHCYYKDKFLKRDIFLNGKMVTVSGDTKVLNTIQMTKFLNQVQADAAAEFGIILPLPADRFYQEFVSEYRCR